MAEASSGVGPGRMDCYEVPSGPVARGVAQAPPSKSHTHRALVCAALASGRSLLVSPLSSDDTLATKKCLEALGAVVSEAPEGWLVEGSGGKLQIPEGPLDCASSGTTLRFMMALCAAMEGKRRIAGSKQLGRRPVLGLAAVLESLGAKISWLGEEGFAPLEIEGAAWQGGEASVPSETSSQFVSALLLAAPLASQALPFRAEGLVSAPYAEMTRIVMARFGARVEKRSETAWAVAPSVYRPATEVIEPDASAAAFLFAAAAVTGGSVTVPAIRREMAQGDAVILDYLQAFGVKVTAGEQGATVEGLPERGARLDMRDCPDLVPPLAAVAFAAPTPSSFLNVSHLKAKESDRLAVLEEGIRALGGEARQEGSSFSIIPPVSPRGARLDPHGDHRMAMAFAVMGLRAQGTSIASPSCVAKSFPGFFKALESLLKQR